MAKTRAQYPVVLYRKRKDGTVESKSFMNPDEHGEIGKEWFENPNLKIEEPPADPEEAAERAVESMQGEMAKLKAQNDALKLENAQLRKRLKEGD